MISKWKSRIINDFVHSVCWMARHKEWPPYLLLGTPEWAENKKLSKHLLPLFAYFIATCKSSLHLSDCARQVYTRCPCNTEEEWQYLETLMQKYYGTPTPNTPNSSRDSLKSDDTNIV